MSAMTRAARGGHGQGSREPGLSPEQHALRATGITATDVVTLAGLNPYRGASAHTIWMSKMGMEAPRQDGEPLQLGHALEPITLAFLARRRSLTLAPAATVVHPEAPTHIATPDAFVEGAVAREGVAEVKAVGLHNAGMWGEEDGTVPDHVLAQCAWQMHVTGLPVAWVGALIGTEVRTYRVERDGDLEAALVETADRFWRDHVQSKRPPTPDGSDGAAKMVRELVGRPRDGMVAASADAEGLAAAYFALDREKRLAEQRLEETRELLMLACGAHEGLKGDGWRLLFKMRDEARVEAYTKKAYRHFDMRKAGSK